jgi:hypothetical protein
MAFLEGSSSLTPPFMEVHRGLGVEATVSTVSLATHFGIKPAASHFTVFLDPH